jgi:hypothetical protein
MKAPQRWLDDSSASTQLKRELAEFEATRISYDTEAGWAELQRAIDSGAAGITGGSAATGVTAKLLPLAMKLALLAVMGGGSIATVRWLTAEPVQRSRAPAPSQPMAAPAPVQIAPPDQTEARAGVVESQGPARLEKPDPAADSRREIAQLARIRALLKRDPAAAHRAILAGQREFPNGLLREEREGLEVIALARIGERTRAREQAQRFIGRYPKSPLRPRLEQLLSQGRH